MRSTSVHGRTAGFGIERVVAKPYGVKSVATSLGGQGQNIAAWVYFDVIGHLN